MLNSNQTINTTIKHIHCIGIGGIGVSGLAELLQKKGYCVSGSDVKTTATTLRLESLGIRVDQGHDAHHINGAHLIVYSSAVSNNNPELVAAKKAGIPIISRGKLLAELMRPYFNIAVVGTHGKTTTTGFMAHTFVAADLDPTYVIGGCIRDQKTTVRLGKGNYFIAEADESDQSFLYMRPNIAVITNIEADHLENYRDDFATLKQAFLQFIKSVPDDGLIVLGIDCPVIQTLLPKITPQVHDHNYGHIKTFGFLKEADFHIQSSKTIGLDSQFVVQKPDGNAITFKIHLPGKHNILNALASVVVADAVGISEDALKKGLDSFPGMGRRFHPRGTFALSKGEKRGSAFLFEDYGHHPTAIAATVAMAKQAWPGQRVVLVFQPHRYSRTRDLMNDFVRAFRDVDLLILLEVYAASETYDAEGASEKLYHALQKAQIPSTFIPQFDAVTKRLPSLLQANDIVIFQGAGDVGSLASALKCQGES